MLTKIILETIAKGDKTKNLTFAIKNRHPVTFYYTDAHTDKNVDRVKPGVRFHAELVALGVTKKGNSIVRGYVEPPSTSKKGFGKSGWRVFRVDRMSNLKISDEIFTEKRPGYVEGEESKKGPMIVTYVTSDWSDNTNKGTEPNIPDVTTEPKVSNNTQKDLPEPNKEKPSSDPTEVPNDDRIVNVKTDIEPNDFNIQDIDGTKYITHDDFEKLSKKLYSEKLQAWKQAQKEMGRNTVPGQGTRKKIIYHSSIEASEFVKKNNLKVTNDIPNINPSVDDDDDNNMELNEQLKRIKTLMF